MFKNIIMLILFLIHHQKLILLPLLRYHIGFYCLILSKGFFFIVVADFENLNYLLDYLLKTLRATLLNGDHALSSSLKLYLFVEFMVLCKFHQTYEPLQNHKIQQVHCWNPNFYFKQFSVKLKIFFKTQLDKFEN